MNEKPREICVWKLVADRDEEKLLKGDRYITLNPNDPEINCFICNGG